MYLVCDLHVAHDSHVCGLYLFMIDTYLSAYQR